MALSNLFYFSEENIVKLTITSLVKPNKSCLQVAFSVNKKRKEKERNIFIIIVWRLKETSFLVKKSS